jgi:hypothetical protein
MTNSGLMTDAQFTVTTVDTSYQNVPGIESNMVLIQSFDRIRFEWCHHRTCRPGYTQITARIGNTYTQSLSS